ncbi:MAG TPA: hypothetical protein VFQ24_15235 [Terriglobia bacterium]|nr:hypothetical protein [Terriglobia bacterium]
MKETLEVINQMQVERVIGQYAIGGAVGATFYLEPSATLDIDIFVALENPQGSPLVTLGQVYDHLRSRGYRAEREHVLIEGWPVQFLPASSALEHEGIEQAVETDVEGARTRVMTAEHLVAVALRTGRAKDLARILQFVESGALDAAKLDAVLKRHGLIEKWEQFERKFLRGNA